MTTPLETAAVAALAAYDDYNIKIVGKDGHPLIGSFERAEYVIEALRPLVQTLLEQEAAKPIDGDATLSAARAALSDYRSNEESYHALPDAEQEGKNYENYEDSILANVHVLAAAIEPLIDIVEGITELSPAPTHDPLIIRAASLMYGLENSHPGLSNSLTVTDVHRLRDLLAEAGVEALKHDSIPTFFTAVSLAALCDHDPEDPTAVIAISFFTEEENDDDVESTHILQLLPSAALVLGSDIVNTANKMRMHITDDHGKAAS